MPAIEQDMPKPVPIKMQGDENEFIEFSGFAGFGEEFVPFIAKN